ncbi:MAG: hypothetical protein AAFQ94_01945 [Bacteroidota bacterium]
MKNITLLSIILVFATFHLSGQPSYKAATVILSNQDSVKGDLRYSFPWKPVLKQSAFKFKTFDKSAVKSYEFSNGRSFQKFTLKYFDNSVENIFAEVFLKGEITYVTHKKKQYLKIDSLENLIRLTKNNYPGVFSLIMPDHPNLVEKSKTMKYTKGNVIGLIEEFHDIEDRKYQKFESKKDKITVDVSMQYGASSRSLRMLEALRPVANQDNTKSSNAAFSFMTDLMLPGFSRIVFFRFGLEHVNDISFDTSYRFGRDGNGFPDDRTFIPLSFSFNMTNLVFGLNFNTQSRYVSPYVSFGGVKPIVINDQDSNYSPLFSLRRDILGYYAESGIIIDLFRNIKPFIGIRYDSLTGSTNTGRISNGLVSVNLQNLQTNFGVKVSFKSD